MPTTFGKMTEEERKFWKDFGGLIFEYRKKAGMTQSEFAPFLNISRTQLANIETGRSRVDAYKVHTIEKVARMIAPLRVEIQPNRTTGLRDFTTAELMAEYMRRDGC